MSEVHFVLVVDADDRAEAKEKAEQVLDQFPPLYNAVTTDPEYIGHGQYHVACMCEWTRP